LQKRNGMWRLKSALKDCLAALLLLLLFRPFGIGGDKNPIVAIAGVVVLVFISSLLSSLMAIVFLRKEATPTYESEMRRINIENLINIPLLALFVITYIGWYCYGKISSGWVVDGVFVLWPYLSAVVCVIIVSIPIYIWNRDQLKKRFLKAEIEELQTLNALLEREQQVLRSSLEKEIKDEKITLQGEGKDSLIVNPLDIMYVESVGNYLSIAYFNESELCQKRLRSSLKEIEEKFDAFPFIIRTHRAFLVNINFITQVSGNSAGYKVSMFSTDRILPVSKANVALFREKIKALGRDLG